VYCLILDASRKHCVLLRIYHTYACYQATLATKAVNKAKVAVVTTEGELLSVKALQEWSLALVAAADAELNRVQPTDEHDDDKKQRKVSASQK
jgi:alpha-N-acetylglucosamine transferase